VPFVVAALIVSAVALSDAEVDLSARLGRWWWILSALMLDDDLIVVDFVLFPRAIGDLVALDGGVCAARLWISLGLAAAVALAVDDALASHRHGCGVCLVGWMGCGGMNRVRRSGAGMLGVGWWSSQEEW
jgi:hypothetical protein